MTSLHVGLRLTNALAADVVAHVREHIAPGMMDAEVAAIRGYVHSHGIGYRSEVGWRAASWSPGPGEASAPLRRGRCPRSLRTPRGCSRSGTVADGYWNDLTKGACPGKLTDEWDGLLDTVLEVFEAAIERLGLGMSLIGLDGFIRERVEAAFVSGTTSW